jgi:hypothetical protein
LLIFCRKIPFPEGADGGIRTHTPLSRERILSPLRLPFRHIGVPTVILATFYPPTNRDFMRWLQARNPLKAI